METSNAMSNLATAAVALINAIIALALGIAALTLIRARADSPTPPSASIVGPCAPSS